ncbi:MAG: tetratricopeptide repeat protein [Sphingobacteriia bacterium]|nr:tetratricopeptide repeat protein [Sphingobacteriia bacterium]
MNEVKRVFLGIGVSAYEDSSLLPLPKAAEDVQSLAQYLESHRSFQAVPFVNPTENDARNVLKHQLKTGCLSTGSVVVLLWSGHGEPLPEGGLHLIARDTEPGSAPELTASHLASYLARCGATQVLLLIDTCFSGSGVLEAQRIVDHVQGEGTTSKVWFGVLAASRDSERARDGILVARLMRLLEHGPSLSALQRRWSAHNEGVRGDDVMDAVVKEWTDTSQHPKVAGCGDAWPMFPNPRFDPDASEQIVEHLRLAAEGRAPAEEGFYFTGRKAPLAELVDWVHTGEAGVFVLTGPAGCGKSAIAGRLVSLSNPVQRLRLLRDSPLESADPGEESVAAHVHARRLTVEQVVAEIDRQLVRCGLLTPALSGGARGRGALLDAVDRLPTKPLIVIDGLDEAGMDAWTIAKDVIGLLTRTCRFLVATRSLPARADGDPTLVQALAPSRFLDLGDAGLAESTRQDVADYVLARLAQVEAQQMDAAKVAEAILALSTETDEGTFLLAQVVTSQLRAEPVNTSQPDWERGLSRSIEDALERDLAQLDAPQRVREMLTALAWSYGGGLPDDLWILFTNALSPNESRFAPADIDWILSTAGRYIIEGGEDGRAVYRLSHQCLVTLLHPPTKARDLDQGHAEATPLAVALVGAYRALLDSGQTADNHRYLWSNLWRHCLDAGPAGITSLRAVASDNPAFRPYLARALNDLGIVYSEVGRRQEALVPTEEAVELCRELAAGNRAFRPELGRSLNTLGIVYNAIGRSLEALASTEEAVALRRALAAENPAFRPDLARALINVGNHYSDIGKRREALASTEEAVEHYRVLAANNLALRHELASVLNNLGVRYSEVGRRQEALAPTEEAAEYYRALAADNPAFQPGLGMALINLGCRYHEVGKCREAIASTEKAVERYRALAADNPVFRPDLGMALNNLGTHYSAVGRHQEAVTPTEEAVDCYRALAADNPAFRPDLARALNNLGGCYSEVGCRQEALAPTEEAVEYYRALAADNPAFLPGLAGTLNNLGNRYSEVGRPQEAVALNEEAVEYYRALADDNLAFLPDFAGALNNLGIRYSEVGRPQEAVAPNEEAVECYRALAADNPAFRPGLAGALNNLGIRYSEVGRPQEAVAPNEEAVECYRALAADNPAFRAGLAAALNNLGICYDEGGRPQEAVALTEEAAEYYRALAADNPTFRLNLASALSNLGGLFNKFGRLRDAVAPAEEALALRRALATDNSAFLTDLVGALNNLGICYDGLDRAEEIDGLWLDTLALIPMPEDRAYLLLRRAESRPPGDPAVVAELIQAQSLLGTSSPERVSDLHQVFRACRQQDSAGFDAAWVSQTGTEIPEWLLLGQD